MNDEERNMKMRSSLFPSAPLALFLAMTLPWWSAPASAQATIMSSSTLATSTSSTTTTTSTAALVAVTGVVTGGDESVSFSGRVKVSANVVTDPDFGGTPIVVLSIDLSGLSGVGAATGKKYVTSDEEIVNRRLTAADTVQYTFPFYQNGASALSARVGLASFNLSFDVNTLKLTSASGSIGSPQ
jgi:hypothetical protein